PRGGGVRAGYHITLYLPGGLTSVRRQAALASFVFLVILGFCLIIAVLGYQVAMRNQMQVSPVLEISMMWPYMAIPVGAGLTAIEAVLLLLASVGRVFKPE
ncbi:MAG: TRAP transporter small permease subunit, partial [Pararhodobacter sp.]|nr:TRAP transporter small permease subunit [Pararhodobacter sp.]